MKTDQRPLEQGFPRGRFFLCLWLKLWSAKNAPMAALENTQKVRKTRSFLSKRAVFLVDDTGLEPVTSRTSTQKCDFYNIF